MHRSNPFRSHSDVLSFFIAIFALFYAISHPLFLLGAHLLRRPRTTHPHLQGASLYPFTVSLFHIFIIFPPHGLLRAVARS
jgi:hypothetical protein